MCQHFQCTLLPWAGRVPSGTSSSLFPHSAGLCSGLCAGSLSAYIPCENLPQVWGYSSYSRMQDGLWHTVLGTMESCLGTAALYTSPDFKTWTSAGAWTDQVCSSQARGTGLTRHVPNGRTPSVPFPSQQAVHEDIPHSQPCLKHGEDLLLSQLRLQRGKGQEPGCAGDAGAGDSWAMLAPHHSAAGQWGVRPVWRQLPHVGVPGCL